MKRQIVLLIASLLFTESAARVTGSFAINPHRSHVYGWAISRVSQSVADSEALTRCIDNCAVAHQFSHTCAAYAGDVTPKGSARGWGENRSLVDAESVALRDCQTQGGSRCVVLVWGCDR